METFIYYFYYIILSVIMMVFDIKSAIMVKSYNNNNYIEYIDNRGKLKVKELKDNLYYGFVEKNKRSKMILNMNNNVINYEDGYRIKSKDGKDVECYKFELINPSAMNDIRKKFNIEGYLTGECDIQYWRRMCLDKTIKCNCSKDNILYVDIEVDDSKGFPKEYGKYKILCIGAYDTKGNEYYYDIYNYSEEEMLVEFVNMLKNNCFTIISGWNIGFDYNHILERLREFRLWDDFRYFTLCQTFDLFIKYKETIKGLSSYSLAEVSLKEGYELPKHREKLVSLMNENELKDYNLYDVWLCKDIDKRYGFSIIDIELSNFVNLPINEKSPIKIGDYTVINRLRELGNYVAITANNNVEKVNYEGALVLEPISGVHTNVVYVDVNSLYPNVIINNNIDIDGYNGEVFPYLMRNFLDMRAEKKKLYKETGEKRYDVEQQVYKILANSHYGLLALKYFRYYNPEKAGQVTGGGRDVLMKMKNYLEDEVGAQVIYGDTDSEFVSLSNVIGAKSVDKKSLIAVANTIVNLINEQINPFTVKLEDVFNKVLFMQDDEGKGIKKRYIAMDYDGNYYYRGIELRRSDYCKFAKDMLNRVIDWIMKDELSRVEIEMKLKEYKMKMYQGEYDENLIIAKSVAKEDYKVIPPHIKAYMIAKDLGYEFTDYRVKYVFIRDRRWKDEIVNVYPVFDVNDIKKLKIDYSYYWDKQIYAPIKRLLSALPDNRVKNLNMWF